MKPTAYPITDLQGINQRQDVDKIPTNRSPLLVNIDVSKPGSWRKRKGTVIIPNRSVIDSPVLGLITYKPLNGEPVARSIKPSSSTITSITQSTDTYSDLPDEAITDSWNLAQSFTATVDGVLRDLSIKATVSDIGSGGSKDFNYEIRADDGGDPTGALLGDGSFTVTVGTADFNISDISVNISNGTKYWLVINAYNGDMTNGTKLAWHYTDTDVYAGGEGKINYPAPNVWTNIGPTRNVGDFAFNVNQLTADNDLFVYQGSGWTSVASSVFTNQARVSSVNYIDRVYHISKEDFLSYETGGTLTEVGAGADRIKGNTLAVAQNTLLVGGNIDYPDRVYYSRFDIDNNVPTDILWEETEGSLANSTRFFSVGESVTAMFTYSVSGRAYIFTQSEGYTFDISNADNAYGVVKKFNIGCANPRAITECNGWLIWMDASARIWAWGGSGPPVPYSWEIEDDTGRDAIINKIKVREIQNVCAGSIGSQFYFSVGDIDVLNRNLENAVIKGLVSQNFNYIIWSLDTYPFRPTIFANTTIDQEEQLLMGTEAGNVYIMNTNFNDDGGAINAFALTSFYKFGSYFRTKSARQLAIKFRPQPDEETYITVAYSIDGGLNYTTISDPDQGIVNYGKIDTYSANSAVELSNVARIQFPAETRFRTLSLEIGNAQLDKSIEVSAMEMLVMPILDDIRLQ